MPHSNSSNHQHTQCSARLMTASTIDIFEDVTYRHGNRLRSPINGSQPHHDSQSISIKRPYVFAVWFAPPKVKVAHYFTPPQNRSSSSTSSGHNWSSLACGHAVVSRAITAAYQRGGTHNSKRPWLNHYWAAMRCMVARYSFARENVISRSTLCTTSW